MGLCFWYPENNLWGLADLQLLRPRSLTLNPHAINCNLETTKISDTAQLRMGVPTIREIILNLMGHFLMICSIT